MFHRYQQHIPGAYQKIQIVGVTALLALALVAAAAPARAQSVVPGDGATTLTLSPHTPEVGEEFTARVEAYSYDLPRARIAWEIDGASVPEHDGQQEIALTAPALGETLVVTAQVTETGGTQHRATRTLTGSTIDLITEADTRVPHFYAGRALPSPGSTVRIVAEPSLYTPAGVRAPAETFVYTWHRDGRVLQSGRGMRTLTTEMPQRGALRIGVTAETPDGSARHTSYQEIRPTSPTAVFYEESPLYGLARNALPGEFTLLTGEISVRAEPYHVSRDVFESARYAWSIDGNAVANPNTDQQTITLQTSGGRGSARVEFSIRNLTALLQSAAHSFVVHFQN